MKNYSTLEQALGIEFKNKDLLTQAFLHRSYLNENTSLGLQHNERFEFLGDAVLELAVTDHLYHTFTDKPEGELTAFRAALVNTISISDVAKSLGFEDYLLLSKGESKDTGKARQYILANTFESFIGALYLDSGYAAAQKFIQDHLFPTLDDIISKSLWRDAKSFVQEQAQEIESVTPSYKVIRESGPDHDKVFTVGIFFGQKQIAEGAGSSKQEAEQEAARKALEAKGWK
ncbi:MAG: ribonuclease III [Candidatus Pacebacteria bacterium]|nr:ribonuclease III [Candidatus Paceibacterota bacterium]